MNGPAVRAAMGRARAAGRRLLLETEGLELLDALGIAHPRFRLCARAEQAAALPATGNPVVVKVMSPEIPHKSDVGGVAVVPNRPADIARAVASMEARLRGRAVAGYLVAEYVEHDASFGGELLASVRWTREFGPVVTIGAGGVATELLASRMREGEAAAVVSARPPFDGLEAALSRVAAVHAATRVFRGRPPRVSLAGVADIVARLVAFAEETMPDEIAELEINPLAVTSGGLVALDVLVTLSGETAAPARPRPVHKIGRLLRPRSAAVVGVSERVNAGRLILDNMLRAGFEPSRLFVVKPGVAAVAGCRCVPDVASLPEPVDLLVVATAAAQVPGLLREVVQHRRAESVVVIPGGLEEKSGGAALAAEIRDVLEAARATEWGGPVLTGGNCLGVRSRPGRCDTFFIPAHKLPPARGRGVPLAVLSQSGAFALARGSRLAGLDPEYVVSVGNQTDLTFGDYLTYLADDPAVQVFAVYVEGFRDLDGLRFLEAAGRITASGRTVVLYRAGRTPAGAHATAGHTASIAGDYGVTRALCEQAGVLVAETLEDLDGLVGLFARLGDRVPAGRRLAALSNAGFEAVAMADAASGLDLASLAPATRARLGEMLRGRRLDTLVDVGNPLDLTPMADDAAFEESLRAMLADEGVDLAVVGCIPMTGALATLPAGAGHAEDLASPSSIVSRLGRVRREIAKPWVAVVDTGALYDPMAAALEAADIPTFRTADRAVRLLGRYAHACLRRARRPSPEISEPTLP